MIETLTPTGFGPAEVGFFCAGLVIAVTALCFGIRHTVEDQLDTLSGLAAQGTIRDNLYFSGGAPCVFNDSRPESLFEGDDLAAWQAHAADFDAGSLLAAPMLTADGHLNAASPAVDAIAPTPGVSFDIDGAARSGSYDLGADER
jgi:hypothetical protein